MEEESMILRDLPVNTRNYTILDNVTGKPIDQNNYSLTIDKEVISKLNKLKEVNEEKRRQASLKGQYAEITLVDTFTPKDNAVFTPIYQGEYIDAEDYNESVVKVENVVDTPAEEKVSSEVIKQDTLLERVVARDPSTIRSEEDTEDNDSTQPADDTQPIETPAVNTPVQEKTGLQEASEQIVKIEAEKLGRAIKPPKEIKDNKKVISLDKMEIKEGKGIAWMAYILFFIPLLLKRNNRFVRLHANIGLELNILELLSAVLILPYFMLTTLTGTAQIIITIMALVGVALIASCLITLLPMLIGAMCGKVFQRPWLFRSRLIKVSLERP